MAQKILESLCSAKKLDRDRGLAELKSFLKDNEAEGVQVVEEALGSVLREPTVPWESRHGSLMGSKLAVKHHLCSNEFAELSRERAAALLTDDEVRVRIAAGELLGELCRRDGVQVYLRCRGTVLEGVATNLERDGQSDLSADEQKEKEKLMEKLFGTQAKEVSDAQQIFHDTAGWRHLETWMKCLQEVIEGCGSQFNPHVTQSLLDLLFRALTHTNRFVRETGFNVCGSLVTCSLQQEGEGTVLQESDTILLHGQQLAEHFATGLADNWSQVRMAASVATRKFLLSMPSEEVRKKYYPLLLPRLCLNRYYVAEGVRIYSQETWKKVTQTEGKALVEEYITQVVDYYMEATTADNHAVREAACACIAELGSKINRDVVRPHVPTLIQALLESFKDDSWPVRDAACVACGNFIQCFPEECRPQMDNLYPLFFANLQDNIPSVRQGAAVALANVARAYGTESLQFLLQKVQEGLEGIEKQPASTEKYSGLDKGPATYGVVKKLRDNDMDLHTNQTMYSCGSLAPKMGRGRGGGCMDHQFRKPAEPWELTEGCVHLLAELSQIPAAVQQVAELLPQVAQAAAKHHYPQHLLLLETVCKQLPVIGRGVNKQLFKRKLEDFLDPIFYSLSSDNQLTCSAAAECLLQLSHFLGPNILRGRVEMYNPHYLDELDKITPAQPSSIM
ncbi:Hypp2742 [Branchiostoma lanceolatum]|uniref:Hypp2742 protein n=1 Tax=Branchiostoma lanceolatum TaxID=7740 RepID=A0A8J9ZUM0_BRALA|nr:Hypp2742 [Branchiostoma lanceolatum]